MFYTPSQRKFWGNLENFELYIPKWKANYDNERGIYLHIITLGRQILLNGLGFLKKNEMF